MNLAPEASRSEMSFPPIFSSDLMVGPNGIPTGLLDGCGLINSEISPGSLHSLDLLPLNLFGVS